MVVCAPPGEAKRRRTDPAFVLMARTDAVAAEGLAGGIARARQYRHAGADMIVVTGRRLAVWEQYIAHLWRP